MRLRTNSTSKKSIHAPAGNEQQRFHAYACRDEQHRVAVGGNGVVGSHSPTDGEGAGGGARVKECAAVWESELGYSLGICEGGAFLGDGRGTTDGEQLARRVVRVPKWVDGDNVPLRLAPTSMVPAGGADAGVLHWPSGAGMALTSATLAPPPIPAYACRDEQHRVAVGGNGVVGSHSPPPKANPSATSALTWIARVLTDPLDDLSNDLASARPIKRCPISSSLQPRCHLAAPRYLPRALRRCVPPARSLPVGDLHRLGGASARAAVGET
eukprot:CAMPEP_0119398060 /NCGR_PEP_ID=MMETSP1334-20130426/140646_1 /TAXON_ID=127549 /ORGANISM="Calcidiscus leptoporus, Strain RCC1130" /LENGTH=269 /DNA_ID=CAMNT_0007421913 /DNA_START=83 /DNA_END=893 /DNA_ORIENTATION=-